MNETLMIFISNESAIPLSITAQTQQTQFWITILISFLGLGFILLFASSMIKNSLSQAYFSIFLKIRSHLTGRRLLVIKHADKSSFFGGQHEMITRSDIKRIETALHQFKGQPFDLVLQTPGGDIFATFLISKMLQTYPKNIRVLIPRYAMSGGTILALSGTSLRMGSVAVLGPVDPQIGLFVPGSAAGWQEVIKNKRERANDSSFLFAKAGQQYTKSIRRFIQPLLERHVIGRLNRKAVLDGLTDGGIEHGFQLDKSVLDDNGFVVGTMSMKEETFYLNLLRKIEPGIYYA